MGKQPGCKLRFGSALNHHVHLHACVTDGVFVPAADHAGCDAPPTFLPARPITQADLAALGVRHIFRQENVPDAATAASESDLVADVGANPTYFIAIVPEPSHGIFAAVALACLAWRPRRARICSFGFCCIRAVN